MPKIKAAEIYSKYEIDGEGTSLVFINGITIDTKGWAYHVPFFSQFVKL